MSKYGISVFDETMHTTNVWLKDLMFRLNSDSRQDVYRALKLTLHALRDRLPVNTAAAFASQLPMLIRGFYYEGWQPAKCPTREHTDTEFVDELAKAFDFLEDDYTPKWIAGAVFDLLTEKISKGEIDNVKSCLPRHIRQLWPPDSLYSKQN